MPGKRQQQQQEYQQQQLCSFSFVSFVSFADGKVELTFNEGTVQGMCTVSEEEVPPEDSVGSAATRPLTSLKIPDWMEVTLVSKKAAPEVTQKQLDALPFS